MTTRADLRALLTDFRAMVRARGPEELLQVAAMLTCYTVSDPQPEANWLFGTAARHALRWWRWANRQSRWVAVHWRNEHDSYDYTYTMWASNDDP